LSFTAGTKLGVFEISGLLGAGGMGEVYRARDTRLDRDVAIKVLRDSMATTPEALARFKREAKAVAALSHSNILAIYDVGVQEDVSYVVMELLEGETLRSRITGSAMSSRKAVEVGIAIADGLSAAHAKGLVHRDLKPENIFLTTDGHVKILDFGLAHSTGAVQAVTHDPGNSPTLSIDTTPGAIVGTLCYMAPEQARALATDARTDIFAFGCVLYEMLTTQRAFLGETAADTMTAILKEEPKSVRSISAGVGPELERVIERCLEKRPEQRFQSAADLAYTLRAIAAHNGHPPAMVRSSVRWLAMSGTALAVLALLAVWFLRREPSQAGTERSEAIDSLVVLPFVNSSDNANVEYLGDGITETLINTLSRIERLRVIPTSTAFRYKGKPIDPAAAALDLKVAAVVTGRVTERGGRLMVQVELVDARTGAQLWGDRYDRPASDLLTIERDITKDIVDSLQMRLTGEEKKAAAKQSTSNEQAYRLYLEGRYWSKQRTEVGLDRAIQLFRVALSLDRNYAQAQVGLAESYVWLGVFHRPAREMFSAARQAAEDARRTDPTLAEAYATLAFLRATNDFEWEDSLDLFRRGIQLNPRYPTLHHWYSVVLNTLGRTKEAQQQITLALELDPGAVPPQRQQGRLYVNTRQYDRAIEHMRRTIEIDPTFFPSYYELGEALAATHDYEGAKAAFRKMHELAGLMPMWAGEVERMDALAGRPEKAREGLRSLLQVAKERDVAFAAIASVYVALGDHDQAFSWLDKAIDGREWSFAYTMHWPRWDPLRGDPRFASLLRRIRLPLSTPTAP
jgi:serine/threonine-protein kinase